MTRDLISNCGQCFTILAISINFATKVRCFYPLSVVFPFSRICCCFPRLSVTVAGWGKEEGRWARMGQSESSCPPGHLTQAPTLRWTYVQSYPVKVLLLKILKKILERTFYGFVTKAPSSRCPNYLKVKSSIFNNLPNIIPDIYIAEYTWAICPFGGTHLKAL